METRKYHRLGLVSAVLCFLSGLTTTPAADIMWYESEGPRATYKELHTPLRDRHTTINRHSELIDNVPPHSVQSQDKPWRPTPLPDTGQKSALFQTLLHSYQSQAPKRLTSVASKPLRRSTEELSPNSAPAPSPGHRHHLRDGIRWIIGFAVGAASGAVVAALSAVLLHFIFSFRSRILSYRSRNDRNPVIFNKNITTKMLHFLHKDDALEGANLIGEGGSSKVYQVALDRTTLAAIKSVPRLHPRPADQDTPTPTEGTVAAAPDHDAKRILAELETLGFVRHRNLVQLWAYIYKRDSHLLVYECLPRGSLRDAFRQMRAGELALPWPQRHRIMCGVAHGLAYLHGHHSHGRSIVHRDLKPGNILLTDDLDAKLADFGLAAVLPAAATHASTDQLAGTIGFIAPEFHQTLRYSQKADIYSFGVVLAQMVTGCEPTDDMFIENGGSIGIWLQRCLNSDGDRIKAIDPTLHETEYHDEIVLAMKVAVFCMNIDPQLRPMSSDVVTMLLQIRNPESVKSSPLSGHLQRSMNSRPTSSKSFSE